MVKKLVKKLVKVLVNRTDHYACLVGGPIYSSVVSLYCIDCSLVARAFASPWGMDIVDVDIGRSIRA